MNGVKATVLVLTALSRPYLDLSPSFSVSLLSFTILGVKLLRHPTYYRSHLHLVSSSKTQRANEPSHPPQSPLSHSEKVVHIIALSLITTEPLDTR